jgi:hypothetical protein
MTLTSDVSLTIKIDSTVSDNTRLIDTSDVPLRIKTEAAFVTAKKTRKDSLKLSERNYPSAFDAKPKIPYLKKGKLSDFEVKTSQKDKKKHLASVSRDVKYKNQDRFIYEPPTLETQADVTTSLHDPIIAYANKLENCVSRLQSIKYPTQIYNAGVINDDLIAQFVTRLGDNLEKFSSTVEKFENMAPTRSTLGSWSNFILHGKEVYNTISIAHRITKNLELFRQYAKQHSDFMREILDISTDHTLNNYIKAVLTVVDRTFTITWGMLTDFKNDLEMLLQEPSGSKTIRTQDVSEIKRQPSGWSKYIPKILKPWESRLATNLTEMSENFKEISQKINKTLPDVTNYPNVIHGLQSLVDPVEIQMSTLVEESIAANPDITDIELESIIETHFNDILGNQLIKRAMSFAESNVPEMHITDFIKKVFKAVCEWAIAAFKKFFLACYKVPHILAPLIVAVGLIILVPLAANGHTWAKWLLLPLGAYAGWVLPQYDLIYLAFKATWSDIHTQASGSSDTNWSLPQKFADMLNTFTKPFGFAEFKAQDLSALYMNLNSINSGLSLLEKLVKYLVATVEFLYSKVSKWFFGIEVQPLFESGYLDLDQLVCESTKLVNLYNSAELPTTQASVESIRSLLFTADSIMKSLSKNKGFNSYNARLLPHLLALRKINERMTIALQYYTGTRMEAVGVYIRGKPGLGKSVTKQSLITALAPEVIPNFDQTRFLQERARYVFELNDNPEYYDGVTKDTKFVGVDDIGAVRSVAGGTPDSWMQLIRLLNINPQQVNMSKTEEKGAVFLAPDYVIMTTNSKVIYSAQAIDNSALARRCHIAVEVVVKPEFCNDQGMIDPAKVAAVYGTEFEGYEPRAVMYRQFVAKAPDGNHENANQTNRGYSRRSYDDHAANANDQETEYIGDMMDIHQLIQVIRDRHKLHQRRWASRMQNEKALHDFLAGTEPEVELPMPPTLVDHPQLGNLKLLYDAYVGFETSMQVFIKWINRQLDLVKNLLAQQIELTERFLNINLDPLEPLEFLESPFSYYADYFSNAWSRLVTVLKDNIPAVLLAMGTLTYALTLTGLTVKYAEEKFVEGELTYKKDPLDSDNQAYRDTIYDDYPITRLKDPEARAKRRELFHLIMKYFVAYTPAKKAIAIDDLKIFRDTNRKEYAFAVQNRIDFRNTTERFKEILLDVLRNEDMSIYVKDGVMQTVRGLTDRYYNQRFDADLERHLEGVSDHFWLQKDDLLEVFAQVGVKLQTDTKTEHKDNSKGRARNTNSRKSDYSRYAKNAKPYQDHETLYIGKQAHIALDGPIQALNKNRYSVQFSKSLVINGYAHFIKDDILMLQEHFVTGAYDVCFDNDFDMDTTFFVLENGTDRYKFTFDDVSRAYTGYTHQDFIFVKVPGARMHRDISRMFAGNSNLNAISPEVNFTALFLHGSKQYVAPTFVRRMMSPNQLGNEAEKDFILVPLKTQDGDCGNLVLLQEGAGRNKIIAVHYGSLSHVVAISSIIYREVVEEAIVFFSKPSKVEPPPVIRTEASFIIEDADFPQKIAGKDVTVDDKPTEQALQRYEGVHYTKIYRISPTQSFPIESCIERSPQTIMSKIAQDAGWEPKTAPAVLRKVWRDGESVDPYIKALHKYTDRDRNYNENLFFECLCSGMTSLMRKSMHHVSPQVYSFEVGCEGIPGTTFKALNRSSSASFPATIFTTQGKREIFGSEPEYDFTRLLVLELRKDVETLIDCASRGIRLRHYYADILKDERRPKAKVEDVNTRIVSGSPLALTVASRMYFGAFVKWMFDNKIQNGSAVGINVYSSDWTDVVKYFGYVATPEERAYIAGDYKGFDSSHSDKSIRALLEVIEMWYDAKLGDPAVQIRRILWMEVWNSHRLRGDTIISFLGRLPSGHFMTTIINILLADANFRYVWLRMCGDDDLSCLEDYDTYIRALHFGDDQIVAVAEPFRKIFTEERIAKHVKELGYTYTNDVKGAPRDMLIYLDECTFLSRSFVENYVGQWIAPLDLDTIMEMPLWSARKSATMAATNADTAIKELSLHPEYVFKEKASLIRRVFSGHGLKFLGTHKQTRLHVMKQDACWF